MWLCVPDQNSFEQTAPPKLRLVLPAQWILFALFLLIAVCWLKTQLRFTISHPLGSQKTVMLQSLLALFYDQPVCCYPHPMAVSIGSCYRHPVPSFLPPSSEKCFCPRHEGTFHPFLSFILLSTQIFDVASFNSLGSKLTERGIEVSWLFVDLFSTGSCVAAPASCLAFITGSHFFYTSS